MKPVKISLVAAAFLACLGPDRARAGTHFLIEPYSGVIFNQGLDRESLLGLESGGLLAIGGKLKGFPPRFYLYMKASWSKFGSDEIVEEYRRACVQRSYTKLVGGLRTVIPLFWGGNVRLNLEAGAGSMFSQNAYSQDGRPLLDYDETLIVVELGAGINVRLLRWLSVGLMYDYTFVAEQERGDMIATILGEADHGSALGWSHLSATLGIHF
ncbi:MAG: hypothetical protein JXR96_07235 [Deltaproteobacteria bacterium]|nr:hypothetical protein [Deltaproteobacteria bacterium]